MTEIATSRIYKLFTFNSDYTLTVNDDLLQERKRGNDKEICFANISNKPILSRGILWNKFIIELADGQRVSISGISKKSTEYSFSKVVQKITNYFSNRIEVDLPKVDQGIEAFDTITQNKYARYSHVEKWFEQNNEVAGCFTNKFALSLISEKKKEQVTNFTQLFTNGHEVREERNKEFIGKELNSYKDFFDTVENNPLTDRQRLACIVNEDNNLVLAGAGSGKTSVIIAKAGYLVDSGLAKANDILILAYGRKASKETNERIDEKLPHVTGITTNTFHKLGLDIIGEATGKKPSVTKLQEDLGTFTAFINKVVESLCAADKEYNRKIVEYFIAYLTKYQEQFSFEFPGEYFEALRENNVQTLKARSYENSNGKKTLKQEVVKSHEEVIIADYLFVNGIEYEYEAHYQYETATETHSQYQPDFYLPEYDIYLEHLGVDRKGNTAPFVDQHEYQEGIRWKRALHEKYDTTLVETYSYEMREGTLIELLQSKLEQHGVKFNAISYHELLELFSKLGEEKKVTQFTKLVATFLDLFKQSGKSFGDLRIAADQKETDKARCHAFIDIFEPILSEYTAELKRANTIDFSDMIREAIVVIEEGRYKPRYKYILVDEFQDISAIRADLVKSLIKFGKDTTLTCVGDDWQSIYKFSGADINYTAKFSSYFGYTQEIALNRTFRFNDKINDFATTFVTKNPSQLKKEVNSHTQVLDNSVTLVKHGNNVDGAIEQCLESLIATDPTAKSIYILGRYKFCKPDCFNQLSSKYPNCQFTFDTVHGSKGKEEDVVILVDVNDSLYGFPSKIGDDPLLDLVLPEAEPYDYSEERRLFYVAVTRAKQHTYIVYDFNSPSVFIEEICDEERNEYNFDILSEDGVAHLPVNYGKCDSCETGDIKIRVMQGDRFFFGCGNFPFCKNTPAACGACNKYPMKKVRGLYRCQNSLCENVVKSCPRCGGGVLTKRNGKYGDFYGCSAYKTTGCKYTENVRS